MGAGVSLGREEAGGWEVPGNDKDLLTVDGGQRRWNERRSRKGWEERWMLAQKRRDPWRLGGVAGFHPISQPPRHTRAHPGPAQQIPGEPFQLRRRGCGLESLALPPASSRGRFADQAREQRKPLV